MLLLTAVVLQTTTPSELTAQSSGHCDLSVGVGTSGINLAVPYRQTTGYVYAGVQYSWSYDNPQEEHLEDPPTCSSESQGINPASIQVTLNGVNVGSQLSFSFFTGLGSSGFNAANASFTFIDDAVNTIILSYGGLSDTVSVFVEKYPRPTRDVSMNNGENIDPSRCVAECFEVVKTLTTPAYISRDAARSVTLMYRSGRAAPRGHVFFDLTPNVTPKPIKVRVQLHDKGASANVFVPLVGGATEQYFTVPDTGRRRYGVQFDAGTRPTGVYDVELQVRLYWSDGAFRDLPTETIRVIIVNERSSVFGAGWLPADIQRMKFTGKGLLLTTGGGAALYFDSVSTANNKTAYASPKGDFSRVVFNRASGGKIRRDWADSSFAEFDPLTGRIEKTQDRFGNNIQFAYDPNNDRPLWIQDPAGQKVWFSYEPAGTGCWCKTGTIRQIMTPGNRNTAMGVNQQNDLTDYLNLLGNYELMSTVYDAEHRLRSYVDRGRTFSFTYDHTGRIASDSSPAIKLYTGAMKRLAIRYESAEALVFPESSNGTLGTPKVPPPFKAVGAHVTDLAGVSTAYVMDRLGAPVWTQSPRGTGEQTTISRNAQSQPTLITSGRTGQWTSFAWSGPLLTRQQSSEGGDVLFAYTTKYSQLQSVLGNSTAPLYHWMSPGLEVIDSTRAGANSSARITRFWYDSLGRIRMVVDADGRDTSMMFRQSTGLQNTDSSRTGRRSIGSRRDGFGRIVATVRPDNARDSVEYDNYNRVQRARDFGGYWTTFTYDSLNLWRVTDAKSQPYSTVYNALGMPIASVNPRGDTAKVAYDSVGQVVQASNRRGQVVQFTYDDRGRLLRRIVATSDTAKRDTTAFVYDSAEKFIVVRNGISTDTAYVGSDTSRRKVAVRSGVLFELQTVTNRATREVVSSFGRRSGTNWTRSVTFGFDSSLRLTSITPSGAPTTRIKQGGSATIDTIYYGEGIAEQSFRHRRPTAETSLLEYVRATALSRTFALDTLGRIIGQQHPSGADARAFGYNVRNELTSWFVGTGSACTILATAPDGTTCPLATGTSTATSYDEVFNPIGPTYQSANRLIQSGSSSAQYDADGNLTWYVRGNDTLRLYWNAMSQLDSARSSSRGLVKYAYDGLGRRIRRATSAGDRWYLYDDQQIIADLDSVGSVVASYSYFPGIDRPHAMQDANGSTYWYLDDGRGNVAGMVDSAGTLRARYTYSPFGVASLDPGASQAGVAGLPGFDYVGNRIRFAAREYDQTLDMYDMRLRFYDPRMQRFISEDPLGIMGGINLYAYVNNNPITLRDPYGADGCDAQHLEDGWVTVPVEGVRGGALCYQPYILPTVSVTEHNYHFPSFDFDGLGSDQPGSLGDYIGRVSDQAGFVGGGGFEGGFGGGSGNGGGPSNLPIVRPSPLHLFIAEAKIPELVGCPKGWTDWGPMKGTFRGESASFQGDARRGSLVPESPGNIEQTGLYGMRLVGTTATVSTGKVVGAAQVDCKDGNTLFTGRSAKQ